MVASQVTILPHKYYYIISGSSSLNFGQLGKAQGWQRRTQKLGLHGRGEGCGNRAGVGV